MKKIIFTSFLFCFATLFATADKKPKLPSPPPLPTATGKVYFISPKEGETVSQSFKVKLGTDGIKVMAAGKKITGTGHHTIVIKGGWISSGSVVPTDGNHIHLDNGESETTVNLAPGEYTMTLQFSDGEHISYGQNLSSAVHIKVK